MLESIVNIGQGVSMKKSIYMYLKYKLKFRHKYKLVFEEYDPITRLLIRKHKFYQKADWAIRGEVYVFECEGNEIIKVLR
jgi:hypothetical protein